MLRNLVLHPITFLVNTALALCLIMAVLLWRLSLGALPHHWSLPALWMAALLLPMLNLSAWLMFSRWWQLPWPSRQRRAVLLNGVPLWHYTTNRSIKRRNRLRWYWLLLAVLTLGSLWLLR